MALQNPFQNTFNAPPWPSQAQQTKSLDANGRLEVIFYGVLCSAIKKKSLAGRANRQRRMKVFFWMMLG